MNIPISFVLFKPEKQFYDMLREIIKNDCTIYIFCNCEDSLAYIKNNFNHIRLNVLTSNKNIGLSSAYQILSNTIHKDGSKYFFIFDQDTIILPKFFLVKESITNHLNKDMHTMVQLQSNTNIAKQRTAYLNHPAFIINSGSIVNINLLNKIGGFPKNFFVDGVDYFISLMSNINGLKVGFLGGDFGLDHTTIQGDSYISIFGRNFPIRFYGWERIKDVSSSYIKLFGICLKYLKFKHFLILSKFLFLFYIKNILGYLINDK